MNIMLATKALRLLVETVNATGGLVRDNRGQLAPVADEGWLDLAEAYTLACDTLGVDPVIADSEFADENEEYVCRDPAGPDCHDDLCPLHYGDIGDPDEDEEDNE